MRYFVTSYVTVRLKVAVDAEDHTSAIAAARGVGVGLLNRSICDEAAVQDTPQVLYTADGDEVTGYLVDEAGDAEFTGTRIYDADGNPWDHVTDLGYADASLTPVEAAKRALLLLRRCRGLMRAAASRQTVKRVDAAISGAKGLVRMASMRASRAARQQEAARG